MVSSACWDLVMATVVTGATGCVVVVILDAERAKRQQPLRTKRMMMEVPTTPPTDPPTEVPVSRERRIQCSKHSLYNKSMQLPYGFYTCQLESMT